MRKRFMKFGRLLLVAVWTASIIVAPHSTRAWGATGHRIIGRLAIESLPDDLPAFLRAGGATEAVGELAREPDRWKDSGREHDADRDPAHYVNVDDGGRVFGGPVLAALPTTRAEYDAALLASGVDGWRVGYLPYSIIDGWEQLSKDFAYWRAESAASRSVASRAHRAWLTADMHRRESLILRDLGTLAHYVGDGSQPLHVSIHFNGWGPMANPEGFTQDRVHAYFEGAFVRDYLDAQDVHAVMKPYADCHCPIEKRAAAYLATTNTEVIPFYRLQKAGAFVSGSERGREFTAQRLAAGADELRDEIIDAWRASAQGSVGYPELKVRDILAGKVDPFDSLYGLD
jgi:hypothetical protein